MSLKLNGSTDGSVTFAAPADTSPTGTDVTLTLPTSAGSADQVLVTNGSGTLSWESRMTAAGPAFSAGGSSQTLSAATITKIAADTETYDTNSCYDSTTEYRFTPTVAGYYLFNAQYQVTSNNTGNVASLRFGKNGSYTEVIVLPFEQYTKVAGTYTYYLNGSTDYVETFAYVSTGLTISASWFQGHFVRPA